DVMVRKTLLGVLAGLALAGVPTRASASFHFMKIVEVFAGTTAQPTAQYVMLQMYAPGQNFVGGQAITVFDAGGALRGTFTFPAKLPKGGSLATTLTATQAAAGLFGVSADLPMTAVIPAGGGAVCYGFVDCVAWGTFLAQNVLPVPPGLTFNVPTGLVPDMA